MLATQNDSPSYTFIAKGRFVINELRLYLLLFSYFITLTGIFLTKSKIDLVTPIISTLLISVIYTFNRYTDVAEDSINNSSSLQWRMENKTLITSTLLWLPLAGLIYFSINLKFLAVILSTLFIGISYSKSLGLGRFKEIPRLKNVSAGVIWCLATIGVVHSAGSGQALLLFFLYAFILLSCLEIEVAWDYRDREGDSKTGIKTAGQNFNPHLAKIFSNGNSLLLIIIVGCLVALGKMPMTTLVIVPYRLFYSLVFYPKYFNEDVPSQGHHLILFHVGTLIGLFFLLVLTGV